MESNPPQPKKVLIACPTMGIDPDPNKWLKSYLNVLNDIRTRGMTHAPMFIYKDTWFSAMNKVFNTAFAYDFDYILRMDDDVWGIGGDYFSRLLDADKDVIGALYATRYFPYVYAALNRVNKEKGIVEAWEKKESALVEAIGTGIQRVEMIGFGMTLIKVDPFKLVERPLFPKDEICPDDSYFADICMKNNIEQYVHMDLRMAHREITPMNRVYLMNADARMMLQNGIIKDDGKSEFISKLVAQFGEDGTKNIDQLVAI